MYYINLAFNFLPHPSQLLLKLTALVAFATLIRFLMSVRWSIQLFQQVVCNEAIHIKHCDSILPSHDAL